MDVDKKASIKKFQRRTETVFGPHPVWWSAWLPTRDLPHCFEVPVQEGGGIYLQCREGAGLISQRSLWFMKVIELPNSRLSVLSKHSVLWDSVEVWKCPNFLFPVPDFLSVCLSVFQPSSVIYLPVFMSTLLSVCLLVCLSVCSSALLCVFSVYWPKTFLSVCMFTRLSANYVCLPGCLLICLSV